MDSLHHPPPTLTAPTKKQASLSTIPELTLLIPCSALFIDCYYTHTHAHARTHTHTHILFYLGIILTWSFKREPNSLSSGFELTTSWSDTVTVTYQHRPALSQLGHLHNLKKLFQWPSCIGSTELNLATTLRYPGSIAQVLVPLEGSYLQTVLSGYHTNSLKWGPNSLSGVTRIPTHNLLICHLAVPPGVWCIKLLPNG